MLRNTAAPSNASTTEPAAQAAPAARSNSKSEKHPLDLPVDVLANTMPEVEVFSPEGKFIAQRPSLSCWLLGGPLDKKAAGRPRRSMKGVKKLENRRRRESIDADD